MFYKLLPIIILLLGLGSSVHTQVPYHELAKDTIISHRFLLGTTYLLDGKKLNLEVMRWFMIDHPQAYDHIQAALVSDQAAAIGYTIGTLSLLTGYLVSQENKAAGRDMMIIGGGSIGAGLIFTMVSRVYQKSAVQRYNKDIKKMYFKKQGIGVHLQITPAKVGLIGSW